jgi:hypothetical protein
LECEKELIQGIEDEKFVIKTIIDKSNNRLFQLTTESLIFLRETSKKFQIGIIYGEKDVNKILLEVYDDYVTLRRYLIEHGILDRSRDGREYWLKR